MINVLFPMNMGKGFPTHTPMFFGEIHRGEEGKEIGYVSVYIKYPSQADELEFKIDEKPVCTSYVPSNVPELENINILFKKRGIAVARLLNPIISENPDLDVLCINSGPIMFIEKERRGDVIRNSNLLLQALDFYSNFLRKSIAALSKTDYRAARQAIIDMIQEKRREDRIERQIELEAKIREAFFTLAYQISQQAN